GSAKGGANENYHYDLSIGGSRAGRRLWLGLGRGARAHLLRQKSPHRDRGPRHVAGSGQSRRAPEELADENPGRRLGRARRALRNPRKARRRGRGPRGKEPPAPRSQRDRASGGAGLPLQQTRNLLSSPGGHRENAQGDRQQRALLRPRAGKRETLQHEGGRRP